MRESPSTCPDAPGSSSLCSASSRKDLIAALRDPDVERFIENSTSLWEADAHRVGVAARTMQTQVRLHLPALPRELLAEGAVPDVYERVRVQALVRSAEIAMATIDAAYDAHFSMLVGGTKLRRDPSRLHYLRSARSDTTFEFGIFAPGAAMPIAYAAFSPVDRRYMLDALRAVGVRAGHQEILVLTRMHGLPGVPHTADVARRTRDQEHLFP
ncbi:hypothetical protein F8568_010535 [Actinomadura sp. LD22]|uniref:Uncharacterized protein n=1 Tax=Actinomadura physcomitrii TaxID=2650748 RepID=A0A6I4M418_9ACTN|nr:hypothetical protein [Actinomadura physcomitrii]MWA00808.1 hypothetical protein [Actinomadura physcomitrii]